MFLHLSLNHKLNSFVVAIALSLFSTSIGAVLNNGVWKVEDGEFPALIDSLRQNARNVISIDFRGFGITAEQFRDLLSAILDNTRIGHVRWGQIPHGAEALVRPIEDRIHENNLRHSYYPTDYVHGLLSDHSYEDAEEGDDVVIGGNYPTPPGWKVVRVFREGAYFQASGYYSVLYAHEKDGHLVLAHRGSKSIASIEADALEVLSNFILSQQAFAYEATEEAVRYAKEHGYHLSITGHSLGAWLAELSGYFCYTEFDVYPRIVTFDSPGSWDMMELLRPNVLNRANHFDLTNIDAVTYLSAPNIVNCCRRHVGTVYRVFPELRDEPIPEWFENLIDGDVIGQFPRAGVGAAHRHPLGYILRQFVPETGLLREYVEVIDWPRLEYTNPRRNVGADPSHAIQAAIEAVPGSSVVPNFVKSFVSKSFCRLVYLVPGGQRALEAVSSIYDVGGVLCDVLSGEVNTEQYWGVVKAETHGDGRPQAVDARSRFYLAHKYHYRARPVIPNQSLFNQDKGSDDWFIEKLWRNRENLRWQGLSPLSLNALDWFERNIRDIEAPKANGTRLIRTAIPVSAVRAFSRRLRENNHELSEALQDKDRWQGNRVAIVPNLGPRARAFVERRGKIEEIDGAFSGDGRIAVISGIAGAGKSTLAHRYAEHWQQQNRSTNIRWLRADSAENVRASLRHFALDLGIEIKGQEDANIFGQIKQAIQQVPHGLVVFDNVDKEEDIESVLNHIPRNIKILVTTRDRTLFESKRDDFHLVQLDPFSEDEAKTYIRKAFERNGISDEDIRALIESLGTLPVRLSWAVGYLTDPLHRTRRVGSLLEAIRGQSGKNIDPVFYIVIESLKEKSPEAWRILRQAALLDPDFMPLEIFGYSSDSKPVERERTFTFLDRQTRSQRIFREHDVDGSEGNCGFIAIGTNREEAIQLLIDNAEIPEIRRLIAPEIRALVTQPVDEGPWSLANLSRCPESLRQLRERFHTRRSILVENLEATRNHVNTELKLVDDAQLSLEQTLERLLGSSDARAEIFERELRELRVIDDEMEHFIPSAEQLTDFIRDEFDTRHEYLSYFRGGGGTLDAIARLRGFELAVFVGDDELTQTLYVPPQPGNHHRYFLHHVGGIDAQGRQFLNHFNLLDDIGDGVPPKDVSGHKAMSSHGDMERAINVLESSSLATFVRREDGVDGIRVHRIAQEEAKRYGKLFPKEAPEGMWEELLQRINELFPFVDAKPESASMQDRGYYANSRALLSEGNVVNSQTALVLCRKIAAYARMVRDDAPSAVTYSRYALNLAQSLYPDQNHIDVAMSLNDVGVAYEFVARRLKTAAFLGSMLVHYRSSIFDQNRYDECERLKSEAKAAQREAVSYFLGSVVMKHALYPNQKHHLLNDLVVLYKAAVLECRMREDNQQMEFFLQEAVRELDAPGANNDIHLADFHYQLGQIYDKQLSGLFRSVSQIGLLSRVLNVLGLDSNQRELLRKALESYQKAYRVYVMRLGIEHGQTQEVRARILALDPNFRFPPVDQPNPQGQGTETTEEQTVLPAVHQAFLTYYARGLDELLPLRIQMLENNKPVKLVKSQWLQHDSKPLTLSDDVIGRLQSGETVLIPYNLWGQHWVGVALERDSEGKILVNYMDPENKSMPQELTDQLTNALSGEPNLHFVQIPVAQQRYNNCGPEVIENFVLYLTGNRVSQEEAVPLHSWLLERRLVPADEATPHKVAFLKPGAQFDEKLIAQTQHYTETGDILPTLQLAVKNGVVQLLDEVPTHTTARQNPATVEPEYLPIHTFDEKLMAQARHYENTGEMFQTLQATMSRGLAYFITGEAR